MNTRSRIKLLVLALVTSAAMTVAAGQHGARAQSATKAPYLVGSSNELTGSTAALGRPFVAGATTYFKWRNDQPGVTRAIVMEALDDQGNPDIGVTNVKKLLGEGAIALLAPIASAVGIPMLPIIEAGKVPMIAHTGVEQMELNPYYYAVGLDGSRAFRIAAGYIKSKVSQAPKIAFFTVDSPALSAARDATVKLIQSWGWQVVGTETFALRATEFNAQALRLADVKPDYIISAFDDGKAPIAVPTLQRTNVSAPAINFPAGNGESAFKAIASPQFLAIRDFVDASEPSDGTKMMKAAAEKYGTLSVMTGGSFTKGWVTAQIFAAAIDSCGDACTGEKIRAYLDSGAKIDAHELGPELSLSATKKIAASSGRIYQWSDKDGRAVPITPYISSD